MQIRCPHCSDSFDSVGETSWADISCPSCGGSFSLTGDEPTCTYAPGFEVLGRFVLLEMVGAGQFGSVWKALDTQLRRNVAVKIPRQRNPSPQQAELFLRDARAAAQLKHPNIAGVHEVGREDDTIYIVTDYIDGANLHQWLSLRRPSPHEAAALMIKIADAVHHAHEAGVVHRDLKPGNIMLDSKGNPYVIDFGLARRDVGEMTVTIEGQVLGTPAYMSPEQARGEGHHADRRSDTYSLGVILFKLLTGELPFRGETRMLILQILEHEPPSPRQLDANVPRDLATITLKCLEKDPARRYQSAGELADDLKRYLAGEPIKARPVGQVERAWRWCKRHPEVASLSVLLLFVLTAVSMVAPFIAIYQARLRRESELRSIELQDQIAGNNFQRASEQYNAGRVLEANALLADAFGTTSDGNPLRSSIRQLIPGWQVKSGRPILYDSAVLAAAFSRDGKTILLGGHDPNCTLQFWDVESMTPIGRRHQHADSVRTVAFSNDGQLALTGSQDGTTRLWDSHTGEPIGRPMLHSNDEWVWAAAFSPDAKLLVTGGRDKNVRGPVNSIQLWNVSTGERVGGPVFFPSAVYAVAFCPPDGKSIVAGCFDGTLRRWDVDETPFTVAARALKLSANIYSIAIDPNGSRMLVGTGSGDRISDNCAQLRDAETFEPIGERLVHGDLVYSVAISPDGKAALTGSHDQTARLWELASGQPVGEPMHHNGLVMSVGFSPDGRQALTASADGTVRLRSLNSSRVLCHESHIINDAKFSPNGRVVVTAGDDGTSRRWDVRTGKQFGELLRHDAPITKVAYSLDGRFILTAGDDRLIRLWDSQTGRSLNAGWQLNGEIRDLMICDDGKSVIIFCQSDDTESLELRDLGTGKAVCEPLRFADAESVIAGSRDGRTALVQHKDSVSLSEFRLWNVLSGQSKGDPLLRDARIISAAFSPDSRYLVAGLYEQEVHAWNTATGEAVAHVFRHDGIVNSVAFGWDSQTVLTGSDDKTARLWDLRSGKQRGQSLQHAGKVRRVVLSPGGTLALTISVDGAISTFGAAHLWDTRTCKLLTNPLDYELAVESSSGNSQPMTGAVDCKDGKFNSYGSTILFTCGDGTARLYDVPAQLSEDQVIIRAWTRAHSGYQADANGVPQKLSQSQWLAAQRELAKLQPTR